MKNIKSQKLEVVGTLRKTELDEQGRLKTENLKDLASH